MRLSVLVVILLLLIGSIYQTLTIQASNGSSQDNPASVEILPIAEGYPAYGVELGQGWTTLLSQKTPGVCVEGIVDSIPGSAATLDFQRLYDREQILDSMSIAVSASVSAGVGGASLSASFSKSLNLDNSSTNILATVVVEKGGIQYSPVAKPNLGSSVRFTTEAMQLLKTDFSAFSRQCGDGFVASRRDGGRLDIIFQLSAASSDSLEKQSLSASGHYGPASASLDAQTSTQKILTDDSTRIHQLQQGGTLTMITSAADAMTKVANFATFEKEAASPYQIIVMPYRAIPGYPINRDQNASPFAMRSYLAESLRLADLSRAYEEAALSPNAFYFPFQDASEQNLQPELIGVARSTAAASVCLDKFVTRCALTGQCELSSAIKDPNFQTTCTVLSDQLSNQQKALAVRLLIGINPADAKALAAVPTATAQTSDPKLVDSANDSPYWLYMGYLAKMPLRKLIGPSKAFLPGDELNDLTTICGEQAPCTANLDRTVLSGKSADGDSNQTAAFRTWVLKRRLYPLSRTFCEISLSHPMCFQMDELLRITAELKTHIGAGRGFDAPPPPPAAPSQPPPPPKPEPPQRFRGPCPGRPNNTNCL